MGDDTALLDVVTSANVACGFHAGDPLTMDRTVAAAAERGVAIGAHVSYADLRGFGRRHVSVQRDELIADLLYQLGALDAFAASHGTRVAYVKPHGALYNEAALDEHLAAWVVVAVARHRPELPVVTLPDSAVVEAARIAGIPVFREGFADRGYEPDGSLSPRGKPNSVLSDPDLVGKRAVQMAVDGTVGLAEGGSVRLEIDTICVHGDTSAAVDNARAVRRSLEAAGVQLRPFVDPSSRVGPVSAQASDRARGVQGESKR